jgi:hypothetical protein
MHRYTNFQTILQPADIAVSGNRGNDPPKIDFPDSVVIPIRKVKIPLFIEYHAVGAFQLRLGCRAAIPAITGRPCPRYWNNYSFLIYFADAVAGFFRDIQFSVGAEG